MAKKPPALTLPKETKVPDHVAIILDGNRRWARARGLKPWEGHKAGYEAVKKLAETSRALGIHTFTIWAFSTENWERPKEEIEAIFDILRKGLEELRRDSHKEKVRLIHLGRKDRFPEDIVRQIARIEKETEGYSRNILNIALDYGGRDEMVRVVRKIVEEKVPAKDIDEKLLESYLDTRDQPYPYPDLFIRTSGEQRTSGLLPWQMAYSEFYFETEHLPDFTPEGLREAILDYSRRRRRYGGNDTVEHFKFKPEIAAKFEVAWWRLSKIPEGTRFVDYAEKHLKEQYGLSKKLAGDAARLILQAAKEENKNKWEEAKGKLKKFYQLVKDEVKLAFEPEIVASLEVKMRREQGREEGESAARELYAEVYRISLLQAAKAAHLRVMAGAERRMAEAGMGEEHWDRAEEYLNRFYIALKERVA